MNKMTDTYRTKGLRKHLVEELQKKGIKDTDVLEAVSNVPRHYFVPASLFEHAYMDTPLPIACEQTISQPYTVARQSELLEIKKQLRILEIGTGSGYQAAILRYMGAFVYSIERQRDLYEHAKKLFHTLSLPIASKHGDGYNGWSEFAPFDRILVTCGAIEIPQTLLIQLKINGILVAPVGEPGQQIMTKTIRVSDTEFETTTHGSFRFVPMLKNAQ
ncbi:MAG: protein-L-isoaspartate(D-aspartate) O-methyltransferase [Bacteroidales bacterium]|jgi:protein-L-isoaspartate(D-aspartate) O-methyltransferase|nr:protein-L-isoaspartate(D-aspartate) O-methyltransferase [Bacteroidales bacterium]